MAPPARLDEGLEMQGGNGAPARLRRPFEQADGYTSAYAPRTEMAVA